MKKNLLPALLATALCAAGAFAQAEWDWTSETPDNRDSQWRFYFGAITSLKGSVDETFRAFYAATGQDYKQALEWFLKAAEAGSSDAMNRIGDMYDHGQGVLRDVTQAAHWHNRANGIE